MDKKIFIVILSFQARKSLFCCVNSVLRNSDLPVEIVVVDNASKDGSPEEVKTQFSKVKVIINKKNLGFSGGNNTGIRFALRNNADYIFLLNPDVTIEKNTVRNLLKVAEDDISIGIVGPKIYSLDGRIWSCGGEIDRKRFTAGLTGFSEKDYSQCNFEGDVDFVSGTAMFIRRKVFKDLGLLPEGYFLYYEDVDFCLSAKRAGFRVYFTPYSMVYHDWSSSVGKKSPMKDYFMARNHLLFTEKYAPLFIKLREFLRMPKTILEHHQRDEKLALLGIRDYFLRRFGERDYWC